MRALELKPNMILVSADPVLDSKIADGVASSIRVHMAPEVRRADLLNRITGAAVQAYVQKAFLVGMRVNAMKAILTSQLPVAVDYSIGCGITQEKLNFWLNVAKVFTVPSGLTSLIGQITAPIELTDGSLAIMVPGKSFDDLVVEQKGLDKLKGPKSTPSVRRAWYDPDLSYMFGSATNEENEVQLLLSQLFKSTLGPAAPRAATELHYLIAPNILTYYEKGDDACLLAGCVTRPFINTALEVSVLEWGGTSRSMKASDMLVVPPFSRKTTLVSEGDRIEMELITDWWMNCFLNS